MRFGDNKAEYFLWWCGIRPVYFWSSDSLMIHVHVFQITDSAAKYWPLFGLYTWLPYLAGSHENFMPWHLPNKEFKAILPKDIPRRFLYSLTSPCHGCVPVTKSEQFNFRHHFFETISIMNTHASRFMFISSVWHTLAFPPFNGLLRQETSI